MQELNFDVTFAVSERAEWTVLAFAEIVRVVQAKCSFVLLWGVMDFDLIMDF